MMTNSLDLVGILLEDDNKVLRSWPLHYLESDELPQYLERTSGRYWKSGDIVEGLLFIYVSVYL